MSVLRIKSNNVDVELQLDDASKTVQGQTPVEGEEALHVALIALSLNQMLSEGNRHDWESDMITIEPHPTQWNSKFLGFTNTQF